MTHYRRVKQHQQVWCHRDAYTLYDRHSLKATGSAIIVRKLVDRFDMFAQILSKCCIIILFKSVMDIKCYLLFLNL